MLMLLIRLINIFIKIFCNSRVDFFYHYVAYKNRILRRVVYILALGVVSKKLDILNDSCFPVCHEQT